MPPGTDPKLMKLTRWLWFWRVGGARSEPLQDNKSSIAAHRGQGGLKKGINLDGIEEMMNRRLRTIWLRHTWFISGLAILLFAALIGITIFLTAAPTTLRVAVGPVGSDDVRFVEMLDERFTAQHEPVRVKPVVMNGPVNIGDIHGKSDFDLAVVRGNIGLSTDWPVVAILRQNVVALIVPAASARGLAKPAAAKNTETKTETAKKEPAAKGKKGTGKEASGKETPGKIEKVADLEGKRIGVVTSTDGGTDLLDVILAHYGVPRNTVTYVELPQDSLRNAIRNNQIDVVLAAGPQTGKVIEEAVSAASNGKDGPTFIAIDQAEGIGKRKPPYDDIEIKAGAFGGVPPQPAESLTTLSYPLYLVARRTYNDDKIAQFSKQLYAARQALAFELPGVIAIESPSTDKDAAVVVHNGTAAYLGDNVKTVFDKYGDQIFYGLLIFPIIGSAFAGLFGYFRADKNTQRIRQLHRLLQLVRRARTVDSVEELDALQDEADSILTETIQQSERGILDEMGLATFSLAIEQARLALSEQRSMLVLKPENVPHHDTKPKGGTSGGTTIAAAE